MGQFTGFGKNALRFLAENYLQNSKDYFSQNKPLYESEILLPMKLLVGDIASFMQGVDSAIDNTPSVNKTISKIYRDIRFSKDKTLFKKELWISWKRPQKDQTDLPSFYFSFRPEGYEMGMGLYVASSDYMKRFREILVKNPDTFRKVIADIVDKTELRLAGEEYKKPQPINLPADLSGFSQKKVFYYTVSYPSDGVFESPALLKRIIDNFTPLVELYRFLLNV